MTREEAIERLNIHKSTNVFVDSIAEAIDMAIEALSADAVSLTGTMKYLTKPHNYCEVVRCKDCIRNNDGNFCDIAFFINDDGDGFCNCGERREK